ncbi:protein C1orf43 homolog [Drosophila biarmipes]|uniref:protein C1orf43 homolog n=1 Tax=Drosophila biarmipes TaxID=125945 RepID=UPI0007E7BD0D|nr:protein C1orf43 homolog [Drosophila biarmipes]
MDGHLRLHKVGDFAAPSLQEKSSKGGNMEQLSGVMIIIIISGGVLTCLMLFIFAKRQIMRFQLRGRRGPHVPVGNDAKKALRREIERRLDCIQKITQEPKLLWNDGDKYIVQPEQDAPLPPYYYRMKAVDDVKLLEAEIARADGSSRHAPESLRAFLLTTLSVTLNGAGQRMIHQYCDMYEHARHDPNEFGKDEYEAYHHLLLKLLEASKQLKNYNSRKASPARTPRKQTKMHSLLDPARLRPPSTLENVQPSSELTTGQHAKVNLTLGLQGGSGSGGGGEGEAELATNPLHLQAPCERDLIIRNRIKTPTLDDIIVEADHHLSNDVGIMEDNEIKSISSMQFQRNSSNV